MKLKKSKVPAKAANQRIASPIDLTATHSFAISSFPLLSQLHSPIPALVGMITFLAFLPVLKNGFVDWDSDTLVNNSSYRGLGLSQLQWVFGSFHFSQYQPLSWLTFTLDYLLWWMDPFGYHWTSLILHVGNVIVFYHIGLRLISLGGAIEALPSVRFLKIAAGLAALFFAIHPLRVEPVAWASARPEILSGLFVLSSLYYYVRANASAESVRPSGHWLWLSIGAYVCSLLAGPAGIMLPIVLLILDIYPLRRSTGLPSPFRPDTRQLYWEKAPYFLALAAFCVVTLIARNYAPITEATDNDHFVSRTMHQLAAPAFYLWKAILPIGLSPAYELRGLFVVLYVVVTALLCLGVIAIRKNWPALPVAWFCYLALLLPVFRAEFPAQQILADRYTYLSGLPWALLAGVAVIQFGYGGKVRVIRRWQVFLGNGVALNLLITLGLLTWWQISAWQDAEVLWKRAVAAAPSSRAYFNLAVISEAQGKYDDAVASYRQVAEIDARRWDAHERAGLLLQKRGKIAEAVEHYRTVVQSNPRAITARDNLAAGLVNLGQVAEAVQHFRKLLELAPERNETRLKLGTILAVEGRPGEATEVLTAAAKADPSDGRIALRLGQVLAAQGKMIEAVHYFREATRLRTEDAETHESLGRALSELGKKDEAAEHLREALRILRSTPAER